MRRAAEERAVAVAVDDAIIGDGDHVVQFYERDAELLAAVTPYLPRPFERARWRS